MVDKNGDEKTNTCANCQKTLHLGVDVLTVQEAVLGPRGIVPLGEIILFCSERCLLDYFDLSGLEEVQRRVH